MKLGVMGVTIMASSGDDGAVSSQAADDPLNCLYSPSFPATSPYVTAVGKNTYIYTYTYTYTHTHSHKDIQIYIHIHYRYTSHSYTHTHIHINIHIGGTMGPEMGEGTEEIACQGDKGGIISSGKHTVVIHFSKFLNIILFHI
jgi:hypothetical protein